MEQKPEPKTKYGLHLIIPILFLVALMAAIQFQVPEIIGYDGYLHIRMADLIREKGFFQEFPYTTATILTEGYANLQWLFHVLLIPFTFLGLMLGAKIGAIIASSMFFIVFYWFLKKRDTPYPALWTILLIFASVDFTYRLHLGRPLPLALIGLILTMYLLQKRAYLLLSVITLFYTWLYPGVIIQIFIILSFALFIFLTEKKFPYKLLIFPFLGFLAGMVINPYFPKNFPSLYTQIVQVNLLGNIFNQEWRAWSLLELITYNWVPVMLVVLGIFQVLRSKKAARESIFYLGLASFFFVYMLKTRRMHEYFLPFSLLFSATTIGEQEFAAFNKAGWGKALKSIAILAILLFSIFQYGHLSSEIKNNQFLPWYLEGALWLKENTKEGDLIFINGYSFAYLFFYNPQLRYTHGVDLTYSALQDNDKFNSYMAVLQGRDPGYNIIKADYSPTYIFAGKIKQDINLFNFILKYKDDFELVYEDESVGILKVKYAPAPAQN
ncbi:hypothetical protein HYV84_01210 [Candidatus Woesearchaeota archaeon]|nr:hypothetical protein [Candidatus Woesearchaeota archaeon]